MSALSRLTPREILVARGASPSSMLSAASSGRRRRWSRSARAWEFDAGLAATELTRAASRSLRWKDSESKMETGPALAAAGALMRYLHELQPGGIPHLARPKIERPGGTMPLDEMTRRNLELVESLRGGEAREPCSAFSTARLRRWDRSLLRQWLLAPLIECAPHRSAARCGGRSCSDSNGS